MLESDIYKFQDTLGVGREPDRDSFHEEKKMSPKRHIARYTALRAERYASKQTETELRAA